MIEHLRKTNYTTVKFSIVQLLAGQIGGKE